MKEVEQKTAATPRHFDIHNPLSLINPIENATQIFIFMLFL